MNKAFKKLKAFLFECGYNIGTTKWRIKGSSPKSGFLRIKYDFWGFGYLCKQLSQYKKKEFCVSDPSELCPECLYFGIERFRWCIYALVYKIVQDRSIVERYRVYNSVEGPKAVVFHIFVPMCQFCICRLNGTSLYGWNIRLNAKSIDYRICGYFRKVVTSVIYK